MEKASWESVSSLHPCCLLVVDGYKGTSCLLHCAPELWTTTNSSFLTLLLSAPAKRKVKSRLSSGLDSARSFFLHEICLPYVCPHAPPLIQPLERERTRHHKWIVSHMVAHIEWRPISQKNKLQRHPCVQDSPPHPTLHQKTEVSDFTGMQSLPWGQIGGGYLPGGGRLTQST